MTHPETSNATPARPGGPWLFSRSIDLAAFLGSFALSAAALALGWALGVLHQETPDWAWVPAVILCDVAHVWSTTFRTYLDPEERRQRPLLLAAVPIGAFAAGVALYTRGELVFWRAIAYVAIFHFVRQQYGWVMLYRARAREEGRLGRVIDVTAIYAATLYPLLHWHTHLPRRFAWFVQGDIVSLPRWLMPIALAAYLVSLIAYAVRAIVRGVIGKHFNLGKDIVVVTTAVAWYVGIVVFDSDYAFTVTNVFIHGIPYFILVYMHARVRLGPGSGASALQSPARAPSAARTLGAQLTRNPWTYVGVLWAIAFTEELLWDRGIWHDRTWLFGAPFREWTLGTLSAILAPVLVVPQLTHYVLDGFLWKRKSNRELGPRVSQG